MIDVIALSTDKTYCFVHMSDGISFKLRLNPSTYLKDLQNAILRIKQVYYEKAS